MKQIKQVFFFLQLWAMGLLFTNKAHAQWVHSDLQLQDIQRLYQIADSTNPDNNSYLIRSSSNYWNNLLPERSYKKWPLVKLLQAGITLHKNDQLTISENDGTLIPAVGMQQRFTIGAILKWGDITLQVQPEFIQASNENPSTFTGDPNNGNFWSRYYMYMENKIDNLSRFGTAAINKFYPGQSSLKYQYNNLSMGVSTENLWWGPGLRNSLVLSNQAPGFLHGTIHSNQPIPTNWGNIEFQVLYGKLMNTPFAPEYNSIMQNIWAGGIQPKTNNNRNLFGYILSYNPKWTPNFFIGMSGMSYFYTQGAPINPNSEILLPHENKAATARLGSLFFRYKMPESGAEVYGEYGRANRWAAPWNLFGDTIPTGFMFGFRKLMPLGGGAKKGYILLNAEITQLQLPDARLVFNPSNPFSVPKTNSWYTHPYIAQGYTNDGQVMGASVGPGGNSQTLNLAWVKGKKRIGLQIDRVANNNDFAIYSNISGILGYGGADRYWVNMNYGFNAQWDFGPWLLSGFVQYTNALNYRWVKLHSIFSQPSDADKTNTRFSISLFRYFTK